MANIGEELEAARTNLARLERLAAQATCREVGHRWKSMGGAHCACEPHGFCSVPVHECTVCGDCDYGDNAEADETRDRCATLSASADFDPEPVLAPLPSSGER